MRLDLASLAAAYDDGSLTTDALLTDLVRRIRAAGPAPVWLAVVDDAALQHRLARLQSQRCAGAPLPLYGVPFAVKDNIDVAGLPTTAACPAFSRQPARSAAVVERLEALGAVVLGKTNLDQFATGLVGTRSPYGAPSSVFNRAYISGGSSSGSAVAVAAGWVSFALGTDTAGSGRVPAAFNNIVGVKPSKGLLSTRGVLPACRSLDTVSIFAGCVTDADRVRRLAQGVDADDPFSHAVAPRPAYPSSGFRFGVPEGQLDFCGDGQAEWLFDAAVGRLQSLGGEKVSFDYAPFAAAAALLYQGPFVAERLAALQLAGFTDWAAMDPVVAGIIRRAETITAAEAFQGIYDLAACQRAAAPSWQAFDVMLLPTAPTIFTHAEIAEDPVGRNAKLGLYTNFVNLMDLAAIAVPAGFRDDGLPFGVTLIGLAGSDDALASLGDRLHRSLAAPRWGGSDAPLPAAPPTPPAPPAADRVALAVVGAHLSGQPLNHQLTERQGRLLRRCRTAPGYRLFALAGTQPAKPGLVRDATGAGGIEVEIWELDMAGFGSFTAAIPAPLGIGTVLLEDGSAVKGFLCESAALTDAQDITGFGGWRAYLAAPA
jgi:allophanate hydrolase